MSALLWVLLWALATIFVLATIVLVTPVRLDFDLRTVPKLRLRVAARLLGGMTPAIHVHDTARTGARKAPAAKPKTKRSRRSDRRPRSTARSWRILRSAPGLLADMLRPIHLERLFVDAEVGLEDPADTGHLFGLITALDAARPCSAEVSITVRPDFTGPNMSGQASAELTFTPIAFVPPGVRFAWLVYGARDDS